MGKKDFPDRGNHYKGPEMWKDRYSQRVLGRNFAGEQRLWRELQVREVWRCRQSLAQKALFLKLRNWTLSCWLAVLLGVYKNQQGILLKYPIPKNSDLIESRNPENHFLAKFLSNVFQGSFSLSLEEEAIVTGRYWGILSRSTTFCMIIIFCKTRGLRLRRPRILVWLHH